MTDSPAAQYRDRTARELTVAHQQPGECAYCDRRHARIEAAIARELIQKQRTLIGRCPCDCISTVTELVDPDGSQP
ncbi:hypothetical protein ACFV0B_11270 [Streptomyces xanthophaeus]|uniref:hypothetical protein n=1 Tax=Streptomyces xanthophaeus TaxID=67385 RepID=UPI0036B66466